MMLSDSFKKYFANTSWLMAERVLRMVVALLVGVYVARYLEPEQFGELSYAASFAGLFSALAMLGLDGIVVRELVKDESRRDELLGTAFWLKIVGACMTLFLLVIVLLLTSGTAEEKILILIIASGFLFQSTNVIDFYFQSRVQSKFVVHAQVVQVVISSITKIIFVLLTAPLLWFAIIMLADSMILSIFLIAAYTKRKKLSVHNWYFSWVTAQTLLKDSWPLILSGIAVSIHMKIDQVMIRAMLNTDAVGQYAAAVRISEAWYFTPVIITGSLFPSIINAKNTNERQYQQQLQRLYDLMVWLSVAVALPLTVMSDWLIKLLFGTQYDAAGGVLAIHIWAGIFVFIGCVVGRSLIVENNQLLNLYRNISGMLVNVVLNLALIPIFNINGAAFATIISYAVSSYLIMPLFVNGRQSFMLATRSLLFIRLLPAKK